MAGAAKRTATRRGNVANLNALKHGAHSDHQMRPRAARQKRRLLRQIGARASDLDSVGRAYLDQWARAQAKVDAMDEWFESHGFLDAQGEPQPAVRVYFVALNSARLNLRAFSEHLRARGSSDPVADLSAYLETKRAAG